MRLSRTWSDSARSIIPLPSRVNTGRAGSTASLQSKRPQIMSQTTVVYIPKRTIENQNARSAAQDSQRFKRDTAPQALLPCLSQLQQHQYPSAKPFELHTAHGCQQIPRRKAQGLSGSDIRTRAIALVDLLNISTAWNSGFGTPTCIAALRFAEKT